MDWLNLPVRIEMQKLIAHINRKNWWHVTPRDPRAYWKRGKFLASTYAEAEFYGRPNNQPEKVCICSPLVGDKNTIEKRLLGRVIGFEGMAVKRRLALDARMKRIALQKGYDSIAVLAIPHYKKFRTEGKIPRSIELNVQDLHCLKSS